MFQSFVNFITKFKEYLTFLALVILSYSLISIGNTQQISGFRSFMIVMTAWLQSTVSWIPNPVALKNENRALRELNLELSEEVTRMRSASVENDKLRGMLDFLGKSKYELVNAEVVGRNSIDLKSYLTIDKGNNSGIRRGMAVRTDAGLIGIVIGISDNYSVVELLNNNNIKISAKIERTGINGIFTWAGGEYFTINNIPASFDVKKGDLVISSNFSNKYPPDIPIGNVITVDEDNTSIFHKLRIKTLANIKTAEEVFVVKFIPNEERNYLIENIEKRIIEGENKK